MQNSIRIIGQVFAAIVIYFVLVLSATLLGHLLFFFGKLLLSGSWVVGAIAFIFLILIKSGQDHF